MKELFANHIYDFNGMPGARTNSVNHIIHNLQTAIGEPATAKLLESAKSSDKQDVAIGKCCQFAYFIYFNLGVPIYMEISSFNEGDLKSVDNYLEGSIYLKTEVRKNKFRKTVESIFNRAVCEGILVEIMP